VCCALVFVCSMRMHAGRQIRMCVCTCACPCVRMYVCVHGRFFVRMYVCIYVHESIFGVCVCVMRVCKHVGMHVCM